MTDELILFDGYDQDIPILNEQELLAQVQRRINAAADQHDVDQAVAICAYFHAAAKLSGKSLASALFTMYQRWNDFQIGEDFIDHIFARVGLDRHTVERYIKVANLLENYVPEEFQPAIREMGIQRLIPIAHAVSQGLDIERENWEKLARTTNYAEVREIVNRDIKNVKPREGALRLSIGRGGSILAYYGENSPIFIGSLEVNDLDPIVQKAVERIIRNAGILRM